MSGYQCWLAVGWKRAWGGQSVYAARNLWGNLGNSSLAIFQSKLIYDNV